MSSPIANAGSFCCPYPRRSTKELVCLSHIISTETVAGVLVVLFLKSLSAPHVVTKRQT